MAQAMHNLGRIVDAAFIQEPIEPFAGGSVVGSRVLTKQWSRDSARMAQKNARQDNRPEGSYRPSASVLMRPRLSPCRSAGKRIVAAQPPVLRCTQVLLPNDVKGH